MEVYLVLYVQSDCYTEENVFSNEADAMEKVKSYIATISKEDNKTEEEMLSEFKETKSVLNTDGTCKVSMSKFALYEYIKKVGLTTEEQRNLLLKQARNLMMKYDFLVLCKNGKETTFKVSTKSAQTIEMINPFTKVSKTISDWIDGVLFYWELRGKKDGLSLIGKNKIAR